jgi:uncharacterized protein
MSPQRRILSIDGGGIKGVFPAAFLATLEDAIGDRIFNYFDLIIGTSTGGIIALALGLGFSAREILEFYIDLGPSVFKDHRNFFKRIQHVFSAKYDNVQLRKALASKFGEHTLGESLTRLVIPAMNLDTGEAYLYKTSHHPRFERDYLQQVVDVAMATTAAPSYFPSFSAPSGLTLIDGGMFANNPSFIGVIEAIAILKWNPNSLKLLSLGCTERPSLPQKARFKPMGQAYWARKVAGVFMAGQSSVSTNIANLLLGHEDVLRINPLSPSLFQMDEVKSVPTLKGLGESEARKYLPKLRQMFLTEYVEPFEPLYTCQTCIPTGRKGSDAIP